MIREIMNVCDTIMELQSVVEDLIARVPKGARVACADVAKLLGLVLSDAKRLETAVASAAMDE